VRLVFSGDHGQDNGQAGREESDDGEGGGDGAASGDADDFGRGWAVLQADHRGEEKQIRDEVGDDRHRYQNVIGSADGGAGLAEEGDDHAGGSVGGDGDPWSFEAGMDVSEDGREITINASYKWQARCG